MPNNKPLESLSYKKSNEFALSKPSGGGGSNSLLENQLVAIALSRIEANYRDDRTILKARIYPSELKRLIGDPSHVYSRLKKVSKIMTGHSIVLEDGLGNFKAFAAITQCTYIDGIFELYLNESLRSHIANLEKHFSTYSLSIMTSFKRNNSFRLYECFRTVFYKSNPKINDGRVEIEYDLSELRFMLGLANADDESIRVLRSKMGANIDWDLLYEKLDDRAKVYKRWPEFERNVLKPAKEELERVADIRFEYEGLRIGRSIGRVHFDLYPNKPKTTIIDEKKAFLEERSQINRQNEMPRDIPEFEPVYMKFVGHNNLSAEDIDTLIKKAGFNADKVIDAIRLADKQPQIDNYMGWLVRCIENDWTQTGVLEGDSKIYEKTKEIRQETDENSDDIAIKVWQKMKTFDKFEEFKEYIVKTGITLEALELTYSAKELVNMYTEYNLTKTVNL